MALIAPVRAVVLFLLCWFVGSAAAGNPLLDPEFERERAPWTQSPTLKDILKVSVAAPPIAAGYDRTCAVTSTGGALCWGDNESGALGNDSNGSYLTPNPVVGLSSGVMAITTGPLSYHTCAINSVGGLVCWGNNGNGELGNGTIAPSTVPAPVTGLASGVRAVATGNYHTCALTVAGQVLCWGENLYGQLGYGGGNTEYAQRLPASVMGLSSVVTAITAGIAHTCALTASGGVLCWGYNGNGELGNGTTTNSSVPVAVTGLSSGVVAIAAGSNHTCALTAAGGVVCWGYNGDGELGNGATTDSLVPVAVVGLPSGATQVATGADYTCAVTVVGGVLCWGKNDHGELGNGTETNSPIPVAVASLSTGVARIALGYFHSCAMTSVGRVLCWGTNSFGQFGNGTQASSLTPTPATGLTVPVVAITAGEEHTCALTTAGGVLCWGANNTFQLGNGEVVGLATPTQVTGLTSGITALSSGGYHSCALTSKGGVICWGEDGQGQLGNGLFYANTSVPVQTSITSGAIAITSGQYHECALTASGGVLCWGDNENGGLGDGTTTERDVPVAVVGLSSGVAAISAGFFHTCALNVAGGVQCWGSNGYGQLGNGETLDIHVPISVVGLPSGIVAIAAGRFHTCALNNVGGVLCWGRNVYGQLGNGTANDSSVPVAVTGLSVGVVAIAAGRDYTCALTAAGGVLCWGYNADGELGTGTTTGSSVPVAVSGLSSGVAAIVAGSYHTCAVTTAGTVLCWGYNSTGGLGDGTFANRLTPVIVHHQDGTGSFAANNWFLDLAPGGSKASAEIPSYLIPTFLTTASGNAATAVVSVTASVQFRAQDVGQPIYVFGYVPSSLLQGAARLKDGNTCVLAQLTSSGQLQQASASGLQAYTSNVISNQGQAINLLSSVSAASVGGSTFCVGTATSSSQAVSAGNSVCAATVPAPIGASPCSSPAVVANVPGSLSGLWWNPNESGWGIDFTQREANIFGAWYTYDASGNPKWYVASNCVGVVAGGASGTCTGTVYEVNGPRFFGATFVPITASQVSVAGNMQVAFNDKNNATMSYTVAGVSRSVAITRQIFPITPTAPPPIDYTDLWWNPSEAGWGLAITHQYNNIFLAWYVYDESGNGKPMWYVASNCTVNGNSCTGTLYRTTGPAFGPSFNAPINVFSVGSATVTFTDANSAVFSYTVDGVSGTKPITREVF